MATVKYYTWEVIPTNTPSLKKKCSKCKTNSLYYSSDKFRMNSQKKNVDVWLIYRCVTCDTTLNVTILSRTNLELIEKSLFHKFSNNDTETAWKYAFDPETIKRNNLEADYSQLEYDIIREIITLDDILEMNEDIIDFEIKTDLNLPMKLSSLIRNCFDISSTELKKMVEADIVTVSAGSSIKKSKIHDGMKVIVHREKLTYYKQGQ